ncbi:MAG: CBS domain-containing protein, partial [Euryarchaeota archaeon]|nr:CBS domain-containing protein [Euryarchaeota archaeon]
PPITVATDFTAHEVASTMKQRDISSVVVMDRGNPVGVVTVSDLMKVILRAENSKMVRVSDIMSTPIHLIGPDDAAEEAAKLMAEMGVRVLGVMEGGILKGVITATDLFKLPPKKKEKMDEYLRKILRLC